MGRLGRCGPQEEKETVESPRDKVQLAWGHQEAALNVASALNTWGNRPVCSPFQDSRSSRSGERLGSPPPHDSVKNVL